MRRLGAEEDYTVESRNMRAMILAAGRGERARPLSDTVPKPLFPVNGRPLISYALGLLKDHGITDIVINVHHLADQIEQALSTCAEFGLNITFSREKRLLETGGGIAMAMKPYQHETFAVVNADVICDVDLGQILETHRQSQADATMILRDNPAPDRIPVVEWNPADERVLDIRGELRASTTSSRQMMFTGVQVLGPAAFEYLIPKRESVIDAFYLPALREGRRIHGYRCKGYWADLGTLEGYEDGCREIAGVTLEHFAPLPLECP